MYKRHRQNHDFQISYFLVGGCHTPDAAWALLSDLEEDREQAIKKHDTNQLRKKANRMRIEERLAKATSDADALDAKADLEDLLNAEPLSEACYQAAKDELAYIRMCKEKIAPLRKYAHLSDHAAAEAAQREEWKLELMYRAQNYLGTSGSIPHDHFAAMRKHPDFSNEILPEIEKMRKLMSASSSRLEFLGHYTAPPKFALPEPPKALE